MNATQYVYLSSPLLINGSEMTLHSAKTPQIKIVELFMVHAVYGLNLYYVSVHAKPWSGKAICLSHPPWPMARVTKTYAFATRTTSHIAYPADIMTFPLL